MGRMRKYTLELMLFGCAAVIAWTIYRMVS